MAIAEIRSLRNGADPIDNASRDDLVIGDLVEVRSINTGSYQWSIAFKPEGSAAVFSSTGTEQAVTQNPGTFTVDVDGPYLIRLVLTDGTGTTEQFVRLRALTAFADLKLVAAGERYDTVSVPVDATFDGWADEQNFNLNTLLGLAKTVTSSGRVVYVDADGGDYTSIQSAIDYAVSQGPTGAAQWVVLVRPGTYQEDLTFAAYVHVFGWPGAIRNDVVKVQCATVAGHTANLAGVGESLVLANLSLQQAPVATPVLTLSGNGRLDLYESAAVGKVSLSGAFRLTVIEGLIFGNGAVPLDYAVEVGTGCAFTALRTEIRGQSGILAGDQSQIELDDSDIEATGTYGINTRAEETTLLFADVEGTIAANPSGAGTAGDMDLHVFYSHVEDVSIDGQNVAGTAALRMGSTLHGALSVINGATYSATTPSDTIYYDNAAAGHPVPLVAATVQAALDEIYDYASKVRTLNDAYNGGVPATGSGRTIIADAGAVQIVDSAAPSDPPPPSNTNGNLEVVGSVKLGAVTKPEISLDPNPFDNGPMILMGHEIWANDAPYGGTAWVMGNATGLPQDHNYNLVLGTRSAQEGTTTGRVLLKGGNAVSAVDAGSIYVQGGTAQDGGGGAAGDIYLVPGESAAGAAGQVYLVDQSTGTGATLTAAGAFVNPMVAGIVTFGTNEGAVEVTFAGGENLAAVHALFDATGVVTAAGDPIVLTTVAKGPTAEIYFLGESGAGVDATLGGFNGQVMVPGTWPDVIAAQGDYYAGNTPAGNATWAAGGDNTLTNAIDRIAAALQGLLGVPIP